MTCTRSGRQGISTHGTISWPMGRVPSGKAPWGLAKDPGKATERGTGPDVARHIFHHTDPFPRVVLKQVCPFSDLSQCSIVGASVHASHLPENSRTVVLKLSDTATL